MLAMTLPPAFPEQKSPFVGPQVVAPASSESMISAQRAERSGWASASTEDSNGASTGPVDEVLTPVCRWGWGGAAVAVPAAAVPAGRPASAAPARRPRQGLRRLLPLPVRKGMQPLLHPLAAPWLRPPGRPHALPPWRHTPAAPHAPGGTAERHSSRSPCHRQHARGQAGHSPARLGPPPSIPSCPSIPRRCAPAGHSMATNHPRPPRTWPIPRNVDKVASAPGGWAQGRRNGLVLGSISILLGLLDSGLGDSILRGRPRRRPRRRRVGSGCPTATLAPGSCPQRGHGCGLAQAASPRAGAQQEAQNRW